MCVFFRKYRCGVDVLDKGCGGIHIQVYVGYRIFEVVKSYLCVSVPVLDDDCGAFVRFVYDDSIMDDKLFQGLSLLVCWVVFGFQWHLQCFVYFLFDVFHFHLVYVALVVLLLVCVACICGWLVVYCVEFCVYLFGVCRGWA